MYETTELFKKAISQMNRDLRIRVTIDGKVYEDSDIQNCSTEESILTGDDFKLGSATTSRVELTLLNMDESLSAKSFEGKEVLVEIGIVVDKFAQPVHYASMGTFIVETGLKEKNIIKLTCVDEMIYFEKPYVSGVTFPATLLQILQDACSQSGVELESTEFTNSDYVVNESPDFSNATRRMVVEHISELACGYACINRNSRLEIVTFEETDVVIDQSNYYSMNLSEYDYKIDKVIINNDGVKVESGTGTNSIEILNNLFALNPSETLVNNIFNKINGFNFKPFTCTWQGNVLTAPCDVITVSYKNGESYKSFIAKQKFTYSTGLKCDITTNAKNRIQSEYQNAKPITKELEKQKKEFSSRIEQTDERITLEVEQLNESIATIDLKADNITLSVQSLDERMGSAESSISLNAEAITSKVSQTDYNGNTIASLINQTATTITIEATKVNLTGYATFSALSTAGATIIDGGNIQTGTMSADRIFGGILRLSNYANLYADNEGGTGNLHLSSGRYTFDAGGTIDFQNNPVVGLSVTASFG